MRERSASLTRLVRAAIAIASVAGVLMCTSPARAQEPPPIPETATEPQGFVAEPALITRAVLFADRHFGKGDLNNGLYADLFNMIPGAGWLSAGPGYRKWYSKDRVFVDASAAISVNGYQLAQGRLELPKLAGSRLAAGAQLQWQDFDAVDYFGEGPDSLETSASEYSVRSTHAAAYATLRLAEWMSVGTQVGWMSPSIRQREGNLVLAAPDERTFVPTQAWIAVDTRDFPGHPTRGTLVRAAVARYDDRDGGAFTFTRYESEAAGFIPLADSRVVVAVHGWLAASDTDEGRSVPFYLQPSLGGHNSLRSYDAYRFHDRHSLLANVEVRVKLLTHMDAAAFVDAGNVAARVQDLDLGKRSYGAGLRLHTRRTTFARFDVAHGGEGWRVLFRLSDPLQFSRLTRRAAAPPPFVP